MRLNKKYRLIIEDQSSLEKRVNINTRFIMWMFILFVFVVLTGALGVFILASTPLKNVLPGYLKESERTATEEQHIRLDSLVHVYEVNEAYISSILYALNPSDTVVRERNNSKPTPLMLDSLMEASEEEKNFLEFIRERDKFNITNTSTAAAQSVLFGLVNRAAVISEETKDKYQAVILLPIGATVNSIAEGKVISVASSPKAAGGYEVIIQHPNGFLSKSSRLSNLMVRPGERVAAGQIIAAGTANSGIKSNQMVLELWHDGDPLIPSRYIEPSSIK